MKKFLIAVSALFMVLSLSAQQPQGHPEKKGFSKEDMENFIFSTSFPRWKKHRK